MSLSERTKFDFKTINRITLTSFLQFWPTTRLSVTSSIASTTPFAERPWLLEPGQAEDGSETAPTVARHEAAADAPLEPEVAAGLAWTPYGGDLLFIEATKMVGKGGVTLTGKLGDVMKESPTAAMSYLRANAERLGVNPNFLEKLDVHSTLEAVSLAFRQGWVTGPNGELGISSEPFARQ